MQAQEIQLGSVFLARGWGLAQDYKLCTYEHCWFTLLQVFETLQQFVCGSNHGMHYISCLNHISTAEQD